VGDEVCRINLNAAPWNAYLNGMPPITYVGSDYHSTIFQTFAARSMHPSGVHAALCDGSVDFFSEHVDLAVWRAMSISQGKESISAGR